MRRINDRGQLGVRGFALLTVFFVFFLTLMALVDPFIEVLDEARGNAFLNCPGTPNL